MSLMDLQHTIEAIVSQHLESQYFLVEIVVGGSKTKPNKISIFLEGDEGIPIDYCATISRKVGHALEEMNLIDGAYTLEVSSPGVGEPLKLHRQYQKNIGRQVQVSLKDGKTIVGKLETVSQESITLAILPEKKSKKQTENLLQEISFENILKTIILVSFK
jgi:ribosome maturation factor RimP